MSAITRIGATGAGALLALGMFAAAPAAHAATSHCSDHNSPDVTKVEGGQNNDVVLPAGTLFCVKASTENTGQLTADGETSLIEYVEAAEIVNHRGKPHDVGYYVVYSAPAEPEDVDGYVNEEDATSEEDATTTTTMPDDEFDGSDDDTAREDEDSSDTESDSDSTGGDADAGDGSDNGGASDSGDEAESGDESESDANDSGDEAVVEDDASGTDSEQSDEGSSALVKVGAGVGGISLLGGLLWGGERLLLLVRLLLRIG